MSELKKLLVGIDLLQTRQGEFLPPVTAAVNQALWLAEGLSSNVTFFAALDLPEEEKDLYMPLGERERVLREVDASAQAALTKLVEQATEQGVRAESRYSVGQGWTELTREAMDGHHDLVLVGTRNLGTVRRALVGSTAMKLLRNCPSPVWVAKPSPQPAPSSLLVASDFSIVADDALRLALQIGAAGKARVHLLHVLECPYAQLWEAGLLEARHEEWQHEQARAAAERRLKEQLARVAGSDAAVEMAICEGPAVADDAIEKYVEQHHIDLLVIGTSARRGLAGAFLGNTAERLLTSVNCSLLAVKPTDFLYPVQTASRS